MIKDINVEKLETKDFFNGKRCKFYAQKKMKNVISVEVDIIKRVG